MSTETVAAVIGDTAIALSFLAALGFGIGQVRTAARDRRDRLTVATVQGMQTRELAAHFQRLSSTDLPSTFRELQALPPNVT